MSVLTHSIDGDVATIVIDNPPQNRFAPEFTQELSQAVDAITRSRARAVVLRAEGPDFSYGGDFRPWLDADRTSLRADFDHILSVIYRFEQLPIPVVAAVQGLCFGGGFELALRADIIFAGESARFGHPEQSLGIVTLLVLQAAINMGVVTMVLPNKGLALPFISYGGSNLAFCLACVGILISIYRHGHGERPDPEGAIFAAKIKKRETPRM